MAHSYYSLQSIRYHSPSSPFAAPSGGDGPRCAGLPGSPVACSVDCGLGVYLMISCAIIINVYYRLDFQEKLINHRSNYSIDDACFINNVENKLYALE